MTARTGQNPLARLLPWRALAFGTLASFAFAATAHADPTIDQLKASYDETVRQLQESQDRKNQLANENEQLKARVAELEAKLIAIDAQSRQAEFLRSQYVAWQTFIERYPLLLKRFQEFAQFRTAPPTVVSPPQPFFDPEWPFSRAAKIEERPEDRTDPTSAPTSQVSPLVRLFHGEGATSHWCALCAAAQSRRAEAARPTGDALAAPGVGGDSVSDLLESLPPR